MVTRAYQWKIIPVYAYMLITRFLQIKNGRNVGCPINTALFNCNVDTSQTILPDYLLCLLLLK